LDHDQDIAQLLSQAEWRVTRRLGAILRAEGSSVEQWRVLRLLSDDVGHPMTDVAEYAMLPGPTVTRLVDRMVSDNLVYRRADDWDRRRVLVYLSEYGKEYSQKLSEVVDQHRLELAEAAGVDAGKLAGTLSRLVDEFN
jgi:DNA-binding MarR family transcriptional regulator